MHVVLALRDRTVSLIIDGALEAQYTVEGAAPTTPEELHEAVLFGSGDDFNGMSAIIDGLSFFRTNGLRPAEANLVKSLYVPLHMPAALSVPLADEGPDTIFDKGLTIRVAQLVMPEVRSAACAGLCARALRVQPRA
jgi:hypothetical protein